jgi:8-oxo-dGTP diphosphatase
MTKPTAGPRIPEFGKPMAAARYPLRPGGYAIIFDYSGDVTVVSTPSGLALPGGGQNDGESPEDATVRETDEECGLRIELEKRLAVADQLAYSAEEQTHYRKRCTFFLARIIGSSVATEKDHELIWLSPQVAASELLFESQRWAVEQVVPKKPP